LQWNKLYKHDLLCETFGGTPITEIKINNIIIEAENLITSLIFYILVKLIQINYTNCKAES